MLRLILIGGIAVLVISVLSRLIRQAKPLILTTDQGAIRPERATAWVTVIAGTVMCLLGILGIIAGHMGWVGAAVLLFGACIAGFMAPSLTSIHIVYWNSSGIEGPSNLFGPTLGLKRTKIAWTDIVKTGTTITSYWFIESSDGRRVYWSYLYKGYGALTRALKEHCPNLDLLPKMG